ncbi:hypothetical protein BDV59DRAFT_171196 [Aspergillus ambiguus]|uniref:RNA 5'-triphosphatase domain-containing protein n=1 Tax=Aspergillus ambiguus TaxID=176160 RepID=UPI003CCD5875
MEAPGGPLAPANIPTLPLRARDSFLSFFSKYSYSYSFFPSIRSSLAFGEDASVNWGGVVFLTTCLVTMVGCHVLSSFLGGKGPRKPSRGNRRFGRRNYSKSSAGTITSSEDEDDEDDYDSTGSLRHGTEFRQQSDDAFSIDPGLLKKHSSYLSYTTSIATYPSIRTFYREHPQSTKLPTKPTPIPLLVFIHGLGGSLSQFSHLLTSLSNVGPCFGIDLPGCGLSSFQPTSWDAYTVGALAELLATAIEQHRDKEAGQGVILIGHSLGCSLSALLASSSSPIGADLKKHILGLIAICPRASPLGVDQVASIHRILRIPGFIFDFWRRWDRRGGLNSASVNRLVGPTADSDTRNLQLRYNKQSQTPVWRRMVSGTLPQRGADGKLVGGLPGEQIWSGVQTPVLLVAGESDTVNKPTEIMKLKEYLGVEPEWTIKPVVLPAPASHALLYDRATYRILAGIIQDFLRQYTDHRLDMGWQLKYLNTSGKWDVKNLAKWKNVTPVSERIADTFVALKMLREVDEEHNPVLFSEAQRGKIYAVIDISYENPVYDPASLEKGGIHYHKHPTVSKIPPTPDETRDFITLVDRLQNEITEKLEKSEDKSIPRPVVGVHCHYGFNRTGFLIVCYLIERCGYGVQDAIDEFERRRPPGIRHAHFIDTLFVRYCVGLKRSITP